MKPVRSGCAAPRLSCRPTPPPPRRRLGAPTRCAGIALASGGPHARGPQLNRDALRTLAGDALLEPAAAALLGALHAVETIKAELGLGTALQLPDGLQLGAGGQR